MNPLSQLLDALSFAWLKLRGWSVDNDAPRALPKPPPDVGGDCVGYDPPRRRRTLLKDLDHAPTHRRRR